MLRGRTRVFPGGLLPGCIAVLVPLCLSAVGVADVAVPVKGPVVKGVYDPANKTFVAGEDRIGLLALLLIERDNGTFVWAESDDARWRGYHRMIHEQRRAELVDMSKEAVRARDHVTARRLYQWAKKEGLEGKAERLVRTRVEKLERKPRKINRKRIAPVLARERELRALLPALLVDRTKRTLAKNRPLGLRFLRRTLHEFPDAPGVTELLAGIHPKDATIKDARRWLDWHLDLEAHGFRFTNPELNALKREQHRWRPDLYGIETDRVRVITPLRRMDLVADCARRLQITEATLAELFKTPKPKLRRKEPLTLHLFIHKPHFQKRVGYEKGSGLPPWNRWPHGKADSQEDVIRAYAPDGAAVGFVRLTHALVHESADLWIDSRCPRFATNEMYYKGDPVSGYGVADGIHGFLAEAPIDFAKSRFDLAARGTPSLRFVAKYSANLIPWPDFFLMNRHEVARMVNKDPRMDDAQRKLPVLGRFFRHQAVALNHYLYNAKGGKYRKALARYIAEYYTGQQTRMNPKAAFGMTAAELGVDVVAYARRR